MTCWGGRLNSRILRPVRVNVNGEAQCDSRKKRRTASFQVLFHKLSKLLELSEGRVTEGRVTS